ncbi:hypothetical protein D3C85_1147110 [compost metagenome]
MLFHCLVGFLFIHIEQREQHLGIGYLERIFGMLEFRVLEHITVSNSIYPFQIEYVLFLLNVGSKTLHTVGNFHSYRACLNSANLLEVGELGNLHTVKPYFPDVMLQSVYPKCLQAVQIDLLDIVRGWLNNDLKLMMLIQPVRVLPIPSIRRSPGWLHISHLPRLWT